MMTSDFSLASTMEPYAGAANPNAACYGITTQLWVPPGNLLDSSLAPMQQAGVVQQIIETKLASNIKALPLFVSKKCHLALRKYFCSSYMLGPSLQLTSAIFRDAGIGYATQAYLVSQGLLPSQLLAYSFYMPSYPHRSVCLEYASACGDFIELAGLAALVPNCTSVVNGVIQYPVANQTLKSLPLVAAGQLVNLKFQTPPNMVTSASDSSYQTQCPEGFVVPDTDDPRITWVTGTGCAVSCQNPMWTKDEWKTLIILVIAVGWVGIVMFLILIVTWLIEKERRQHQYLVICFATYALLTSVTFVSSTFYTFEQAYCVSNAVPVDDTDGLNFCNIESNLMIFSGMGCVYTWLLLSFDLFLKIAVGVRHTSQYKTYYLISVAVMPILFVGITNSVRYGFTGFIPFCFLRSPHEGDLETWYIPITVMSSTVVVCMLAVLYRIILSIIKTSGGHVDESATQVMKKLSILKTPILFLVQFLICFELLCLQILVMQKQDWKIGRNVRSRISMGRILGWRHVDIFPQRDFPGHLIFGR